MDGAQVERLSAAATADLLVNGPLSERTVDLLVGWLAARLEPSATVLDIGCGKAELLLRLAAAAGIRAVGVDTSPAAIAAARIRAGALGVDADLIRGDAAGVLRPADAAICIGATHALGDLGLTLDAFADAGCRWALVGEVVWEAVPPTDGLEAFGMAAGEVPDPAQLVADCGRRGWQVVEEHRSDRDEWDAFEHGWVAGVRRWVDEHPEDEPLLARAELLESTYASWRRRCMGFATLLLTRAPA